MSKNKPARIVVKVGSSTLTDAAGRLDKSAIADLVRQLAAQCEKGAQIVLVTSGAIRAGMERLNMESRPRNMPEKQAAAAVGQGLLLHMYTELFDRSGITAAQVLLTRDDFSDRSRYLNARNTLNTLLSLGAAPIVNENDTVATEEIKFGENDTLAAMVAAAIGADLLILLSDVEGLYDMRRGSPKHGQLVPEVKHIGRDIVAMAGGTDGPAGSGGMRAKIEAAKIAMRSGVTMVIADGRGRDVVADIAAGRAVGTRFVADARSLNSRKRWVAFGAPVRGALFVNAGARDVLLEGGKSLLAAGIVDVQGNFKPGDLVAISDESKMCFGRGFVNYGAAEVRQIKGRRSGEIEQILGYKDFDEVIHRDNMVMGV
ncbi:MAG: glutamate 5-kinase [Armatimonadota bacterium]|nr:glutamate 5-kinase [Armatimonadota bacterium]